MPNLKTITQIDWKATREAWEEDGGLTAGPTSFSSSAARTFKTKALFRRLPTAARKRLYQSTYSSDKCLHCDKRETSDHILECTYTKTRLDLILAAIATNSLEHLNLAGINETFYSQQHETRKNIIKGLVPWSWTERAPQRSDAINAAAKLINNIISAFRREIWIPWCKARKQWEKNPPANETLQADNPTPIPIHPSIDIKQTSNKIMEVLTDSPYAVIHLPFHLYLSYNHS